MQAHGGFLNLESLLWNFLTLLSYGSKFLAFNYHSFNLDVLYFKSSQYASYSMMKHLFVSYICKHYSYMIRAFELFALSKPGFLKVCFIFLTASPSYTCSTIRELG